MVEFKKLLVIPFGQGIYIECNVLDLPYFKDVYIDEIYIDNQDTYNINGISTTPIYYKKIDGDQKSIRFVIKNEDLAFTLTPKTKDNIFFIYVKTKGVPASNTPCGLDIPITTAAAVENYSIYRRALKYIRESYEKCDIPRNFIDFILRYKAFQLALKTRDFPLAVKYWKMFTSSYSKNKIKGCGCHG